MLLILKSFHSITMGTKFVIFDNQKNKEKKSLFVSISNRVYHYN